MKLLLDTHIAIWLVRDADELTAKARRVIDSADQVFVSTVSIWEATIKAALGKLPLLPQRFAERLIDAGIEPLSIHWDHAQAIHQLKSVHGDPFDRMLVAQAVCESMRLLTHDAVLARYTDLVIRV